MNPVVNVHLAGLEQRDYMKCNNLFKIKSSMENLEKIRLLCENIKDSAACGFGTDCTESDTFNYEIFS